MLVNDGVVELKFVLNREAAIACDFIRNGGDARAFLMRFAEAVSEGFDPERFTPERSAGRHRTAYLPFAVGPRKCIGDTFAMLEMQMIVAMAAQRFKLNLAPGLPVVPTPAISLRPKDALTMHIERVS